MEQTVPKPESAYSSGIIHLSESWEVNHWCEELNLRADELTEIIKRVGPSLKAVRKFLEHRQN